ncbi:MAG: HAD family hydrolase [Dehalococcoidia bacterium]|jgi:putative hydrolase of the HAD superfamily|nr:HAD family hydrolase [Dehalococcoidia bacterium]
MTVRAVCFDFQDTLAYYPDGNYAVYVRAASERGVSLTQEQLRTQSLDDAWARWRTPLGVDHAKHSHSEAAWRTVHQGVHASRLVTMGVESELAATIAGRIVDLQAEPGEYALFDDTVPALERLGRAAIESIIVSNHIWRLPEVVAGLGIGSRLEGVLTSARVGYRKPHPQIYAAALRLARCEPSEVLFVGDNPEHDVDGPAAAGMRTLLLDRAGAGEGEHSVRSLLEIPLE